MNKFYLIIILLMLGMNCAPIILQMKPYSKTSKIELNKKELIAHIRYVASNYFVSAKNVIDNVDTVSGLIHIDFLINMADEWGTPLLGEKLPKSERTIDVKLNIFVKDSAFKIESTLFTPRNQNAVDIYTTCGKTQQDFDSLQQKSIDGFVSEILKEKNELKEKWNF